VKEAVLIQIQFNLLSMVVVATYISIHQVDRTSNGLTSFAVTTPMPYGPITTLETLLVENCDHYRELSGTLYSLRH